MGKELNRPLNQGDLELTRASVKPKLEEGVVFMSDERKDTGSSPQPDRSERSSERSARGAPRPVGGRRALSRPQKINQILNTVIPEDAQQAALTAWKEFYSGKAMLPGEELMIGRLAKSGILPQAEQNEEDTRLIDEFKLISELPDGDVGPDTMAYLTNFSKEVEKKSKTNEPVNIELSAEFKGLLHDNGIPDEIIERNSDHPEKLMQMLVLRVRVLNEREMARSIKPDTDDQDERPMPDVTPIPVDIPEPDPIIRSDQELAAVLEDHRRQRRVLYERQVASLRGFFSDPDVLKTWADAFEREGQKMPEIDTLIAQILPYDKAERELDRNIDIRAHESEIARDLWEKALKATGATLTPEQRVKMERLIAMGKAPIAGGSDDMSPSQREYLERVLQGIGETIDGINNVATNIEVLTMMFGRSEGVEAGAGQTHRRKEWGRDIYVPKSLEQLTELVMNRADPEYRIDRGDGQRGEYCLFNFKPKLDDDGNIVRDADGKPVETNEIASVNTVNFLRWARDNYLKVHLMNPLDEVNFFSDIATNVKTEGFGSALSFYELTFTESYFFRETVGPDGKLHIEKDPEYDALRNQILMEIYLLQIQRNPAVSYVKQQRAEREKMINAIVAANIINPLTRDNFAELIFSAPSTEATSILDQSTTEQKKAALGLSDKPIDSVDLLARIEGNAAMGTATREAIALFINIADWDNLVKIIGEDSVLFRYEYDAYDEWSGKKDEHGQKKHTAEHPDPAKRGKRKKDWFNEDGTLKKFAVEEHGHHKGKYKKDANGKYIEDPHGKPHPDFMKYLNIYLTPTPDVDQQKEMRERIRLAIMERNGISYREAQIAELMAYSMSQINGVAARADVDSVGFDWWTRVTNFLDKRKREKSGDRDAPYGADYNMEGVKRIGLTFFEAAKDRAGRSIRKIIQGGAKSTLGGKYAKWGEGGEIHIQEDPLKNLVEYEYSYQRDDAGNIKFMDINEERPFTGLEVKTVEYDPQGKRLVYKDGHNNEVEVRGAVPVKEGIVFRYASDGDGHAKGDIKDIHTKVVAYRIDQDGVKFIDETGTDVTELVGKDTPSIRVLGVDTPLKFEVDISKQFLPNHLMTAAQIYKWVFSMTGYHLEDLVVGRDPRGFPILDHKKVDEIKHGINHDIRYAISTWGKINFAERHREWEQVELRDSEGYLIDSEGRRLDEETFLILEKSRIPFQPMVKTGNKSDPAKFLRVREMTRLESMFGAPALIFIKAELERRGLHNIGLDGKPIADFKSVDQIAYKRGVNADIIHVADETTGDEIALNISAATVNEGEFRKAVFQGVIDYYIASELREGRAFGTGHHYLGYIETAKAKDAAVLGKIMDPARMDIIAGEAGIETYKMFWEYFKRENIAGGLEGLFRALMALIKTSIS